MLKSLEIIMSLITGIILLIMGFIYHMPLLELVVKLLITMVVFYMIGLLIKRYLMKTVFNKKKNEAETSGNKKISEKEKDEKNAEDEEDIEPKEADE